MQALKLVAKLSRSRGPTQVESLRRFSAVENFSVFPREREGNNYAVNWSLTEDGVVPAGDAFRNARIPLLSTRLSSKVSGGKVELSGPAYSGSVKVLEAGESISHDEFNDKLTALQNYLSSGIELFVEDAALGAVSSARVGVRIVSESPAFALITRNLLIPVPPRPVDHRARFNGWNSDDRWAQSEISWNGKAYDILSSPSASQKGQRPVVALVGGSGDSVAVQFIERSGSIVGANVIAGSSAPVRGVIDAVGLASSVVLNEVQDKYLAVPSTVVVSGSDVILVVGADDKLVDDAAAKGTLYGAYHNAVSVDGVTALWNGVIKTPSAVTSRRAAPAVVVAGKAAIPINPDNLAGPVTHIVFYAEGSPTSTLSAEDATKRLVDLTSEARTALASAIVKGAKKISVSGNIADLLK